MQQRYVFQTIIAIFALLVGYPMGGSVFIVLMVPFVLYMVVKKDAGFLPALMIHCASSTSIMYAVFVLMMIMCFINANTIWRNVKTRFPFIILIILLPIFIVLLIQKMRFDLFAWQNAFGYTSYYLSFWAFLYCCLLAPTFNKETLKLLLLSLFITYIIGFVIKGITPFYRYHRVISFAVYVGIIYGVFFVFREYKILRGSVLFLVFSVLFVTATRTFTELLTVLYAIFCFVLWNINKRRFAQRSVSVIPYVFIIVMMVYGVMNYETASYGSYSEQIDFTDWNSTLNRAKYKFFDDRALFWSAAWDQLMIMKPIFPIHNIPDITAYKANGQVIDDISFGAHNTPLQLLRIFGFIMGGLLSFLYIYYSVITSKVLLSKRIDQIIIPLILVVQTYVIISFWTGTAAMLCDTALFTFGLMGIAYGLAENNDYDSALV